MSDDLHSDVKRLQLYVRVLTTISFLATIFAGVSTWQALTATEEARKTREKVEASVPSQPVPQQTLATVEGVQIKDGAVVLDSKGGKGTIAVKDDEGRQRLVLLGDALVILDHKGQIRVRMGTDGIFVYSAKGELLERLPSEPDM